MALFLFPFRLPPMAEPELPLSPPTSPVASTGTILLGKYQLGRFLGRGSFAKVYQARSLFDGSTVAVKIIDKVKTVHAAMEPRIVREIDAMRRLHHHPNILKIHEVMATKSKIYLVVEFASGGELFAKISRRGRLSESAARRYFQQLVSALDFCHKNGVAHRDVKPQNLLLDKDGILKVSDFGLSALPEQLQNGLLHTACGTPAYTAPEVVSRRGYDGSKADAWSCGVILFVLLSGYLPFDDSNIATMYNKIYRRDYQFPDWISKPAKHLIFRLLDPNPKSRTSIEALMRNSWFKKSIQSKLHKDSEEDNSLTESFQNCKLENNVPVMNAFDIISMSSGLNLSGLFEVETKKNEKRFTTKLTADELEEKVKVIGGEMGFCVKRLGKNRSIRMGKGRVVLTVEVSEMAPSLLMVQMKVVEAEVEFEELHWKDLKTKLQDIIVSWHCNNNDQEEDF